jgi:hypothetical protein
VIEKAPLPIAANHGNGIDGDPEWKREKRSPLLHTDPMAWGLGERLPVSGPGKPLKELMAGEGKALEQGRAERRARRTAGQGIEGKYSRAKVREM